jgi:hypothetical protein
MRTMSTGETWEFGHIFLCLRRTHAYQVDKGWASGARDAVRDYPGTPLGNSHAVTEDADGCEFSSSTVSALAWHVTKLKAALEY